MSGSLDYRNKEESIAGTLQDGRTIVRSRTSQIVQWVLNLIPPFHVQVNFRKLDTIDTILDINLREISPEACAFGICQKKITAHATGGYPVVGFTVTGLTYIANGLTATGVTVTSEVVVIGW